jgi:thymidylate kinase
VITILEGPDGAGKTTLAKSGYFDDHAYVHLGPPTSLGAMHDCVQAITKRRRRRDVLFDRLHLGERVYGPIHRGVDTLGAARARLIERVLLAHRAVLVLCLPDEERCLETYRARRGEEMLESEAKLKQVCHAYGQYLWDGTHLPVVHYSYEHKNPVELRDEIDRARRDLPANAGPGVGAFIPGNTLIVGEQVNDRASFPFVDDRGCAIWLAERLDEARVDEKRLYWVNALDPEGDWTDPSFVELLQPRQVIALGRVAEAWCRDAGLDHAAVPHPQNHKRFRYHQRYPLLDLL